MAQVFLRSVAEDIEPRDRGEMFPVAWLRHCAAADVHRSHRLTNDAATADLVLFAESHRGIATGEYFERVLADPVYRRFRRKSFIHSGVDLPIPLLPGIFPSIERRWCSRARTRSGPYLAERNPFLRRASRSALADEGGWLASFLGCADGKPVRERLLQLRDDRILVRDTTEAFIRTVRSGDREGHDALKKEYVDISVRSRFLLCPRGTGTSTIRLFEAMELGRAPVILADDWVEPKGPMWNEFSLRVPERRVADLPRILREAESLARRMGDLARAEWERWYSEENLFHTIVEDCLTLAKHRRIPESVSRGFAMLQFLRPIHARRIARNALGRGRAAG